MYFVACLWFKKEKAQKCASDLLTKAQSEKRKAQSAKRKAKAQFIKPRSIYSASRGEQWQYIGDRSNAEIAQSTLIFMASGVGVMVTLVLYQILHRFGDIAGFCAPDPTPIPS